MIIPYDMKCAKCHHSKQKHLASWNGIQIASPCWQCPQEQLYANIERCLVFVFDNLNYVEALAEKKNLI